MQVLAVPQGRFELGRFPARARDPLRAWDAADEYVLNELADRSLGVVVLVNDGFGALATALAGEDRAVYADSHRALAGARANLLHNGVPLAALRGSLDPLPARVDTAVIKLPKSLALLEDQLHRLRPALHPGSVILGAGMTRHVHTSTLQLFERLVGPTRTSLARKKARLIHATLEPTLDPGPNPWPRRAVLPNGLTVVDHAGVFSPNQLDIGTRLLLEHLPTPAAEARVIDLGCGDGALGVTLAARTPSARVTCLDESHMAVASARATFAANGLVGQFRVADCLEGVEPGSVDLIVNNPPFHDGHAVGDAIAWRMFAQSAKALAPGGALWVVGNRHLGYHAKLGRLFGGCETVAANRKFVVLRARR